MCEECGCGLPGGAKEDHGSSARREHVELYRDLMAANVARAQENRAHLMDHGVLGVNLMSSPGSGKTSLIESLAQHFGDGVRMGVIEGDLATDRDAARIGALKVPVVQITTGSTCHLDGAMVHDALHRLPLGDLDILFVENVGNLVCPGLYDLGCHLNGVLLSVTEGDDKVAKYPLVFHHSQFFCITKVDLLPHLEFDPSQPRREARLIKGDLRLFELSARTGSGVAAFADYLMEQRRALAG